MENSQNPFTAGQQGSGSSENRGDNREGQKAQTTDSSNANQERIAHEAGLGREQMTDISELGGMSGRDDYSGGSGDDMESQSTDQETDR